MVIAEQEGRQRRAAAVQPEHVLLALALEDAGIGGYALRDLGASAERIAQELPVPVSDPAGSSEPLPWSPGTEQVVSQAHTELVPLGHWYVGTEHLVLAVVQAARGQVPVVLGRLGVAAEGVRREVYNILGHGP
jgi:ATP-dependent Clp protease ATP-binding subunit ClpA